MNFKKLAVCFFNFMLSASCFGDAGHVLESLRSAAPRVSFRPFELADEQLARNDANLMEDMNELIRTASEYYSRNGVEAEVRGGIEYWRMETLEGYRLTIENSRHEYSGFVSVTGNDFERRFDFRDFLQVRLPNNDLVCVNRRAAEPYILDPYLDDIETSGQSLFSGTDLGLAEYDINDWIDDVFSSSNDEVVMTVRENMQTLRAPIPLLPGYYADIAFYAENRDNHGRLNILRGTDEILRINLDDLINNGRFERPDLSQYLNF